MIWTNGFNQWTILSKAHEWEVLADKQNYGVLSLLDWDYLFAPRNCQHNKSEHLALYSFEENSEGFQNKEKSRLSK